MIRQQADHPFHAMDRASRPGRRLHQLVDAPGGDSADPGLLDHRHQRLLAHLPGLEERREVGALPELGDTQLQCPQPGIEHAVAIAVAPGHALRRSLVPSGTNQAFHVGLHQDLQHCFGDGAQEVAIASLLQEFRQCQSVLGHRILVGSG
jgi:hypothetical protein